MKAALFRFSRREYLENFRNNGSLYMNNQKYFSGIKNLDPARGDKYEGTDRIHQPSEIESINIIDKSNGVKILFGPDMIVGPVKINFGIRSYNLFCLYSLTRFPENGDLIFDERNFAFGDSFVAILNPQEFLNRVEAASRAANLEILYGPVEYYDALSYSGETGPFWKPDTQSYQREFRIAVSPGSSNPIHLSIGSLKDITTPIFPLADINNLVKMSPLSS